MPRPSWLGAAIGVVVLVTGVASQQAPQQPTFRARVDLVELDVSVLDRDRRPVGGLTKDDFTIFEDGKPQAVAVFEAITSRADFSSEGRGNG